MFAFNRRRHASSFVATEQRKMCCVPGIPINDRTSSVKVLLMIPVLPECIKNLRIFIDFGYIFSAYCPLTLTSTTRL